MRLTACGFGIFLSFLPSSSVWSQEIPRVLGKNPPGNILDDRIDKLLRQWSDKTSKLDSMYAEFTRITVDQIWKNKTFAEGSARYLAPNKARLDILGEEAISYVLTGKGELWEFRPNPVNIEDPRKNHELGTIKIWELNEDWNRPIQDDGPLPFLLGTDPEKAKSRFILEILAEDDRMVRLLIIPKLHDDQQNFHKAALWLDKESFLPIRLIFLERNGNEVTYEFKKIWANTPIRKTDFTPKVLPGWRVERQKVADFQEANRLGKDEG